MDTKEKASDFYLWDKRWKLDNVFDVAQQSIPILECWHFCHQSVIKLPEVSDETKQQVLDILNKKGTDGSQVNQKELKEVMKCMGMTQMIPEDDSMEKYVDEILLCESNEIPIECFFPQIDSFVQRRQSLDGIERLSSPVCLEIVRHFSRNEDRLFFLKELNMKKGDKIFDFLVDEIELNLLSEEELESLLGIVHRSKRIEIEAKLEGFRRAYATPKKFWS